MTRHGGKSRKAGSRTNLKPRKSHATHSGGKDARGIESTRAGATTQAADHSSAKTKSERRGGQTLSNRFHEDDDLLSDQDDGQSSVHSKLPFSTSLPILLVGEGDFSFACCLCDTYACSALTATTIMDANTVRSAHSHAAQNIQALIEAGHQVLYSVDATKLGQPGVSGGAALRRHRFGSIIFNFPHVGGKTSDVARQARANQQLLLGFFAGAQRLLLPQEGRIILSSWEGPAYDAWRIRDLARSQGLSVERSMAFPWDLWTGYAHVKTPGTDASRNDRKGLDADRRARMWVFQVSGASQMQASSKRKRRNSTDSSGSSHAELNEEWASPDSAGPLTSDAARSREALGIPSSEKCTHGDEDEWDGFSD